jgi:activating signal cointegrator 1
MKALSLRQPWATLVAIGAKRVETRSWTTNYRGPLAIHASRRLSPAEARLCCTSPFRVALEAGGYRFDDTSPRNPFPLPLGMVVAVANLVEVRQITASNIPDEPERSFGDYTLGRYAWHLSEIVCLAEPILARGSLGLWEWMLPSGFSRASKSPAHFQTK